MLEAESRAGHGVSEARLIPYGFPPIQLHLDVVATFGPRPYLQRYDIVGDSMA